ncbi:hypothetical protein AHF37_01861 [Paragonimus kellicotti]|nr:hypothetical protein AHF37_01861 [Paragonimus kellicotti]
MLGCHDRPLTCLVSLYLLHPSGGFTPLCSAILLWSHRQNCCPLLLPWLVITESLTASFPHKFWRRQKLRSCSGNEFWGALRALKVYLGSVLTFVTSALDSDETNRRWRTDC